MKKDKESDARKRAWTKSRLAIELSRLRVFEEPKARQEQYVTDPEIAAEVLWQAHLRRDLKAKVSADLGCGTGILGIGMLLLGVKKVYFLDADRRALSIARNNVELVKSESSSKVGKAVFLCGDIEEFSRRVDLVVQNPPFGTKVRHSDRRFLKKAFESARIVYSFHKSESCPFIKAYAGDNGFFTTNVWDFSFPIKATQVYHKRRIFRTKVSCFRLERKTKSF